MSLVIYEYSLESDEVMDTGICTLEMPIGATVRHIDTQRGAPMMWVEVDEVQQHRSDMSIRRFQIVGTGDASIPYVGAEYVGTFLINDGSFVFHVYELVTR